ncbi:GTP-binding protein [uncultured Muribaculum sp.]|uniref:GTP-binding protein n=1 Tax=uncultured Muribaculum sp. TaxID=1918613 RepID=UPI002676B1A5|nr:GTP-binding protein [uncultured Muribaculum sp.]
MKTLPVLLLTGYLGSGKTTLVNHILANRNGIKFAVIVNDIGEINIDASLIEKGGIVDQQDESLVALQNGCICCTLKMDLVRQIEQLVAMRRFDYIVIEASGICEPEPIAQTICSISAMGGEFVNTAMPKLDAIVTVVDALRLQSEFACGEKLQKSHVGEEDIENLIIQQIEFCNIILLNKASEVSPKELGRIREIIRALQPDAEIIECDYADVPVSKLVNTNMFDFERVATSAGWIRGIENRLETEHHHHHHHDNGGETEEYGIETFVYFRRKPFDFNKFDYFAARQWPDSVIRCKGVCYFSNNRDMSILFEQAGIQKKITQAGLWYATASDEERSILMEQDPDFLRDWDPVYGDRMIKLVFIGQHMDREKITHDLDMCLCE